MAETGQADIQKLHVMTGPPGSGKTTLLAHIGSKIECCAEPARRVIASQRARNAASIGDADPAAFVRSMLALSVADYEAARQEGGIAVFDRGLPDLIAYAAYYGLETGSIADAVTRRRYCSQVFWLPAWEEIYETDADRKLDFYGAEAFGARIRDAYLRSGYDLVTVPKAPIAERALFVRTAIGA